MPLSEQQGRAACQRIMKDSPAPWSHHDRSSVVRDADDRIVADVLDEDVKPLITCAPEMLEAMIEFCERVERGEVVSTYTYNKFKALIEKATT